MAESRRVQLVTLPCSGSTPASCGPCGPSTPQGPPHVPQAPRDGAAEPRTVRLVLTLFEPDDTSFPEFSYSQLVDDDKIKHMKDKVQLSRFEEEEQRANDEIAAISRKLEEKYGGKPTKKKDRIQDLIDIGFGYDEEDSFIDNSEAYDEFVPASLSTKFGGFYVNSGVLQFRQTSETEDPATEEETPESSKKRKVGGERDKPKRKRCRDDGEENGDVEVKTSAASEIGHDDATKKKKKKSGGTLSVTCMLKKFQREKEKERLTMAANPKSATVAGAMTLPLCPADAGGGGGSYLTDPLLSLIGSTNDHALIQAASAVDFDIDLDSLLDVTEETSSPKTAPQPVEETALARPTTEDPTPSQVQVPSQTGSGSPHHGVPLPEGLPPRLEDSIRKLMAVAKASEGESKLKFFTPEINSILLDIEVQCRDRGVQFRSKVFTHLSSFLPCSRDTLLKRVKRLLLTHLEEPLDVDEPLLKLKEAIGRAMPEQIAGFNLSCQVYEQGRSLRAAEEEKEGKVKASVGLEDGLEEKGGRRGGGPRKLFKWNEEIRESLSQVLRVKMEQHQKEGNARQDVENQLKTLLDNEVQPLWPKGWMQSRVLIRESRKMLSIFTSLPVTKSRPDRKQPAASDSGGVPQALPQDGGGVPQALPQDGGGVPQALPQDGGGVPQGLPQDGGGVPQGLPQDGGGVPQGLPQDGGGVPQGLPQDGDGVPQGRPQGHPQDGGAVPQGCPQGRPQDGGGIPQGRNQDGGGVPQGVPKVGGGTVPQGRPQDGGGVPQGCNQDGGGVPQERPQGVPKIGGGTVPQGRPQDGGGAMPQGRPQDGGGVPQEVPKVSGGIVPQGRPQDGGGAIPQGRPQDGGGVPQGLPEVDDDDVIIVSSSAADSTAVEKPVAGKEAGESSQDAGPSTPSTPSEVDKPAVPGASAAASTPTHSLLNILADQALAQQPPLAVSHELLAAAVAKYRCSAQRWSFGPDAKSPLRLPPPPPPPQSSPVGFLLSGRCHVVLPLQGGDIAARTEPEDVHVISDDEDVSAT